MWDWFGIKFDFDKNMNVMKFLCMAHLGGVIRLALFILRELFLVRQYKNCNIEDAIQKL